MIPGKICEKDDAKENKNIKTGHLGSFEERYFNEAYKEAKKKMKPRLL